MAAGAARTLRHGLVVLVAVVGSVLSSPLREHATTIPEFLVGGTVPLPPPNKFSTDASLRRSAGGAADGAHPPEHVFRMNLLGREVTIRASLNKRLFADGYRETVERAGVVTEVPADHMANTARHNCHYLGSIDGDPESQAAFSTCDGGIDGRFRGRGGLDVMVRPDSSGINALGPASNGGRSIAGVKHTVRRSVDVFLSAEHACGVTDHAKRHVRQRKLIRSRRDNQPDGHGGVFGAGGNSFAREPAHLVGSNATGAQTQIDNLSVASSASRRRRGTVVGRPDKQVEVLVLNDASRRATFGGNDTAMTSNAASIMSQVAAIYTGQAWLDTDSGGTDMTITVVLSHMHTFAADPWEASVKSSDNGHTIDNSASPGSTGDVDSSDLLSKLHQWTYKNTCFPSTDQTCPDAGKPIAAHDNHVLLSGRDFEANVAGLASVGCMCQSATANGGEFLSGSVNMATYDGIVGAAAATVAHEMGHNFGMSHDGPQHTAESSHSGQCPETGKIMASVVSSTSPATSFSPCSTSDMSDFITGGYISGASEGRDAFGIGTCLENDAVALTAACGNGVVEDGEDCDCGLGDCSATEPCCNGATCKFIEPAPGGGAAECSTGPCCNPQCKFYAADDERVCRASAHPVCDVADTCDGFSAACPDDVVAPPLTGCVTTGAVTGVEYTDGRCYAGECASPRELCDDIVPALHDAFLAAIGESPDPVDLDSDSSLCQTMNDQCTGYLWCHVTGENDNECKVTQTGSDFAEIPDGYPCLHQSDSTGLRTGYCEDGVCLLPGHPTVGGMKVSSCGNGAIDYGEECDCGSLSASDACCDCGSCLVKAGKECAAAGLPVHNCCDEATCSVKAAGTVCRAAGHSVCGAAETCNGASGWCPDDQDALVGTPCRTAQLEDSSCFGGACVAGPTEWCKLLGFEKPYNFGSADSCTKPVCCTGTTCTTIASFPSITNPDSGLEQIFSLSPAPTGRTGVSGCDSAWEYCTGVAPDSSGARCVTAETSGSCATADEYFEPGAGLCTACADGCKGGCTGPTLRDCVGCKYGTMDFGRCPGSAAEAAAVAINRCTCSNGTTATGLDCTTDGAEVCASCQPGFHLAVDGTCGANTCICHDGTEATGAECTADGETICVSCAPGFSIANAICTENSCSCDDGSAATGAECTSNGTTICTACNSGFALSEALCVDCGTITFEASAGVKEGSCTACVGLTSSDCRGALCKPGYNSFSPYGNKCKENSCTCPNGVSSKSTGETAAQLCDTDGAVDCSECNLGYHGSDSFGPGAQSCGVNVCSCANGVSTTFDGGTADTFCETHDTEDCSACDQGYRPSSTFGAEAQSCLANICTCDHGTQAQPSDCPHHAIEKCATCDQGFYLNGAFKCLACADILFDEGTCTRCTGPSKAECTEATCAPGYSATPGDTSADGCVGNVCQCPNGEPAVGEGCVADGDAACKACDEFFHLTASKTQCIDNVCDCGNGTAVVSGAGLCITDGANQCASCNAGFFLNFSTAACQQCQSIIFPAGSGVANDSCTACTGGSPENCTVASCAPGYTASAGDPAPGACEGNSCVCPDGTPSAGLDCKNDGDAGCSACDPFHHMNSAGTGCPSNECSCLNGAAHPPSECAVHGSNSCDTCNGGFYLGDGVSPDCLSCGSITFPAADSSKSLAAGLIAGAVANGSCTACTGGTYDLCTAASCNPGFGPIGGDQSPAGCGPNVCACPNGTPIIGPGCAEPGGPACISCAPLYHLGANNSECIDNVCGCENGVAVTKGTGVCEVHGGNACTTCDSGFFLDQNTRECKPCGAIEFHAGSGVSNDSCTECVSGSSECDQCSVYEGFSRNECNAAPGCFATAISTDTAGCLSDNCTRSGVRAVECRCMAVCGNATCAPGYKPAGVPVDPLTCASNSCVCTNGMPAVGLRCMADGVTACASCSPFFHLRPRFSITPDNLSTTVSVACDPNECICGNGTAVASNACAVDGADECHSCNDGFHLVDQSCVANRCSGCANGTAALGPRCPVDGGTECEACDAGFHAGIDPASRRRLARAAPANPDCLVNTCACSHGTAAVGPACSVDAVGICVACDADHVLQGWVCTPTNATKPAAEALPVLRIIFTGNFDELSEADRQAFIESIFTILIAVMGISRSQIASVELAPGSIVAQATFGDSVDPMMIDIAASELKNSEPAVKVTSGSTEKSFDFESAASLQPDIVHASRLIEGGFWEENYMWFATAVGGLVVVGVVWAGIKQYHVKVMMPKDYKDAVENANSPDGWRSADLPEGLAINDDRWSQNPSIHGSNWMFRGGRSMTAPEAQGARPKHFYPSTHTGALQDASFGFESYRE